MFAQPDLNKYDPIADLENRIVRRFQSKMPVMK